MIRRALILGGLAALAIAPAAPAQTQEGEGTTTQSGSGGANVQSGSGKVSTPPAARTPAPRQAPVVRPAPTAAPRAVGTPRAVPRPVVVAPKASPKPATRRTVAAPTVRCPSRIERNVLQRRAAGQSVRRIASALDIRRSRVRALQRRAVGLLLAEKDPARCDKAGGEKKKSTTTAAPTSRKVSTRPGPDADPTADASSGGQRPAPLAFAPKDSASKLFLYIGIGVLVLFVCLAVLQTRGGLFKRRVYR